MTLELLEAAVTDVYTYLETNMTTKLADLVEEYADEITLQDIKRWYRGNIPQQLPEYPSICLQGDGWNPETQTAAFMEVSNEINIIIYVGDTKEDVRFKRLCRYARAVVELLNSGEPSYGYTHFISGRVSISDSMSAPSYLQAVIIPVTFKKAEDY